MQSTPSAPSRNEIGLKGISFVEFASPTPEKMEKTFFDFGFSKIGGKGAIEFFQQNQINFFLNREARSFGLRFAGEHGPSIPAMGWHFRDARAAHELAVKRGAKSCPEGDYPLPAIYGIGDSLIYFTDDRLTRDDFQPLGFQALSRPELVYQKGFLSVDHLTNNVVQGTMGKWADFYQKIFGFTEVRRFDIHGQKTSLQSYALRSPCGTFCIPINEASEKKSQINEYLDEYRGPGIQHLAFLTNDILSSLHKLERTGIQTLDIREGYYEEAFRRVPAVEEDRDEIRRLNVLVDGDPEGYLLQIFTKNLFGPIFIEMIQRKNHFSFGEGNFQALFDSIERDQEKRGVFHAS